MANNRDKDEMKRFIDNWLISKKYAELKRKLNLRPKAMEIEIQDIIKHLRETGLTRIELIASCHNRVAYDEMDPEEKLEFEWMQAEFLVANTREEIIKKFITTLLEWYGYIHIHQQKEDYELCAQIKKVVEIEKKEFLAILEDYFEHSDDNLEVIKHIEESIINKMLLS